MNHTSSPDVVVVGGGIAGLAAAVHLSARGARVSVVEAKAVLGGRATSFSDPQTGERVDNGQHVLLGCYHETFRLLKAIGSDESVRMQPGLDVEFIDRARQRSRLRCPQIPPPFNLLAGLFEWEALGWADRLAALHMASPIRIARSARDSKNGKIAASPGETVEKWLLNNGQTARIREMLWEPLAMAALNQSVREAAAPPFAAVLGEMFGGEAKDAALGFPTCPLDELYAEPARRFIEARGGRVQIGMPAKIVIRNGAVSHVEARGERMTAAGVVAAVPWHALVDLFDGERSALAPLCAAAARTRACPIASVNLWLDRPLLKTPFLGLPGRHMQWVFDKQQMFDHAEASHLTMISSGADALASLSNDQLTDLALDELRDALPEARSARVERATVVRERRATFSLAPDQPRRPTVLTPVHGLLLAGDWVDTGLPATIEGAALSGRLAAEAAG